MSISMERFASEGRFLSYNPFPVSLRPVTVFHLQCRGCGFEPEASITPPKICPKCHAKSWERFARPGSILDNADRY